MDGWSVYLTESCLCAAVCHITLLNLVYSYGLCGCALYFKFVNVTTSKHVVGLADGLERSQSQPLE